MPLLVRSFVCCDAGVPYQTKIIKNISSTSIRNQTCGKSRDVAGQASPVPWVLAISFDFGSILEWFFSSGLIFFSSSFLYSLHSGMLIVDRYIPYRRW